MEYNQPFKRIFTKRAFVLFSILVINLFTSETIKATETTYSTVAALDTAISNANAGDVLILANGTYYNNSSLTISTSNITVRAATPGGVLLNGKSTITINGSNVVFSGFQFTTGVPQGTVQNNVIVVSGDYVTLTQLNFSGYNGSKYINLQGQYDKITYCNFEKKPTTSTNNEKGNMIHIAQRSDLTPNYALISYCSFQSMYGDGGDYGNECIRITNHEIAEPDVYQSKTIIEHCYFKDTGLGDSEAISVKSDNNIIRFNTMIDNPKANFCFRYGDDNVAYGNFFKNSGGIRIKEANNIHCYNNYFENCGYGSVTAPVIFQYDNSSLVSHLNNLNFVNNTFVDGFPIQLGIYPTSNNGPITFTNNTFANNIFKYDSGNIFSESTSGISWAGNMYQGTLGTVSPSTGMVNTDTLLATNTEGFYGLPSNSPAINASSTSYPAILDIANIDDDDPSLIYDISGQLRVGIKDVGCDEYSTETTTNHPLALTEVGPSYLGGPATTEEPVATSPQTICNAATVNNLLATGTILKWYTSLNSGSPLASTDIVNSGTYYVSQTLNGIESTRKTVAVTVTSTTAPTAASLLLCNGSTVSNLTATGTALKWYDVATLGNQLASDMVLSTTTYYVSQTESTCESSRTAVSVTIYVVPTTIPLLNADGPGNTYELITSVLAPCQGVAAVEAPDMLSGTVAGTHSDFGRHITEVMDADLGKYVFEFYSHVAEDNDITGGSERQRVEIKTYAQSPDNLKGVLGETVTYKWRFKVPTGFQPSANFTHIHQVKAVDGDDSAPLFTLTPRYGTANTLQLIYTQDSSTSTDTKAEVNLSLFENTWVEAIETIKIGTGTTGTYAITIKKVIDGTTILSYSSNAIQTIRPAGTWQNTAVTPNVSTTYIANSFIRPKWGIYRSLVSSGNLRDDSMRFSDISISEIVPPTAVLTANTDGTVSISGVAVVGTTVTIQFPDNTTGSAVAGAEGAYGPIVSGVLLTSGNVVVSYVSSGNTSPETIGQFTDLPVVSNQSFCNSGTVASLTASGTLVKWYSTASGGSTLLTASALATGTYYVTQTVNGLESARKAILITVNTTAVPTASAQAICNSGTVDNLTATGSALKWYSASTEGTALATATVLATGTYYVSQTLNSCESSRTSVAVTVNSTVAPTASSPQTFTGSPTVANLVATIGTALKWYSEITGGTALATSHPVTNGTTYYVSQTVSTCESVRTAVVVTIQTTATQTIDFPTLPLKYTNSPDFDPAAVSSIGSPITYSSSNQAVATITNDNKIRIVARGTSIITASSSGAASETEYLIVQCSCVQN